MMLLAPMAALGAFFATPTTAGAESRVVVDTWRITGESITGTATLPTSDLCLADTFVLLAATTYEGGWASYGEFSYNECTQKGTWVSGSAVPTTLRFWGNLSSAHLVAHIALTDEATGSSAGSVAVDETWTATGPAVHEKEVDSYNEPGNYLFRWTFKGTSREAVTTGTMTLDTAHIRRSSYWTMQVTH